MHSDPDHERSCSRRPSETKVPVLTACPSPAPCPPPPCVGTRNKGAFIHLVIQQISIECGYSSKNLGLLISKEMVLALIFIGNDGSEHGIRFSLILDI